MCFGEEVDDMDWIKSEGPDMPTENQFLEVPMSTNVGTYIQQYKGNYGMFFTFFTNSPQIIEVLTGGDKPEYLVHENIMDFGKYIRSSAEWTSIEDYLDEFPSVQRLEEFDPKLFGVLKRQFPFITKAYVGEV